MADRFVFSTKNIDDSQNYVFSKRESFPIDSEILKYRITKLGGIKQEDVLEYLNTLDYNTYNSFLDNNHIIVQDRDDKKKVSQTVASKHKVVFALIKQPDLADYFVSENNQNNNVFAVKCLEGGAGVEWVNALIEDKTIGGGSLNKDDTLYLILHDKDVPGHDGETFKILSPKEICSIPNIGKKVNVTNNKCIHTPNAFEIRIIVFNHAQKVITDILDNIKLSDSDVANRVKSIYTTKDYLDRMFCDNYQKCFNKLDVDGYVDLMNNKYDDTKLNPLKLSTGRKIFVYEDKNGALLTELMHVRIDIKAAKEFKDLIKILYKIEAEDSIHAPVIIKVYKSFFEDWANAVSSPKDKEKILNHPNKKAMEENLERAFTFFNNSSIWVRLVDINNENAYDTAVAEFEYFDKIGLYDYASAWENLEYNLRFFPHDYLESSLDGHGNFVTPLLYGDEVEHWNILFKDNKTKMK